MKVQVISYSTRPPPINMSAWWSFALGAMLVVPFIGALAIYFARRAMRNVEEQGYGGGDIARRGMILGKANLVLTAVMLMVAPPVGIGMHRRAMETNCQMNLRRIGQGMAIYAANNYGHLPPSLDPLPYTLDIKQHRFRSNPPAYPSPRHWKIPKWIADYFVCPEEDRFYSKRQFSPAPGITRPLSYLYIPPGVQLSSIQDSVQRIVLYEPLSNHKGRGINVLYCDFHVEFIRAPLAGKVIEELETGQNPPPSLTAAVQAQE